MFKYIFSRKKIMSIVFGAILLFAVSTVQASTIPVTYDNYAQAQTSMQMNDYQKLAKGINKWYHFRVPTPINNQPTIRMNRDTLYSIAVVNVTKGVTITLPDTGDRYISIAIGNEYGYSPLVAYGKGTYSLTPKSIGSNYAFIVIRTLIDAQNEKDIKEVNALQDKFLIKSKDSTPFIMPNWNMQNYKVIYDSLIALFALAPDTKGTFGKKEEVNPVLFLLGIAGGFGGLPQKDAMYINRTSQAGKSFKMAVKDVPVDGFWSITIYNKEGYLFNSKYGASSINNLTASPTKDGSYTLYFGNCEKYKENCLAIEDGWNYIVRLYQPHDDIISGKWTFPLLEEIK